MPRPLRLTDHEAALLGCAVALLLALAIAAAAVYATFALFTTVARAAGGSIDEWGEPVASGGPGLTPAAVQGGAVQIDAGNQSDLLVMADGTVWGWGATHVGTPSMSLAQIPGVANVSQRPVDGEHDFAAIESPGSDAACPSSSTLVTWGLNMDGDLGTGVATQINTPSAQDVTALDCQNVVAVAAAARHMIALTADGRVFVWGTAKQLGLGKSTADVLVPTQNAAATALTGGTSAGVEITAGAFGMGLLVNGQAFAWGDNNAKQCGCGSSASVVWTPTPVRQGALVFTWIDQGGDYANNGHTLALDAAGDVYAWGDGQLGQLGQGTTANSAVPLLVPGLAAIVDVRAGGLHSMALDAAGTVWTWGDNADGQLGDGSTTNRLSPEAVLSGVSMISAGSLHSIAQ